MDHLEPLIEISRFYGRNPDYVIAGGGNTSYKTKDKLYVKASGIPLATINADGFVAMSRQRLGEMKEKSYSKDATTREKEVKEDLNRAILSPKQLRPSVETSLHNLMEYAYVVHTHPTAVNALMCSNNAAREVKERFGTRALYMEYAEPGYILFKKLQARMEDYVKRYHESPRIIFLQNHGVFVGGNTCSEVQSIYDFVELQIKSDKELVLPAGEIEEISSATSDFVADYFKQKGLVSKAYKSPLSEYFAENRERYTKISVPFTPDIIVYCRSRYLFLEKGPDKDMVIKRIEEFEKKHGYYPRVIVHEQTGLILVEENEKSIQTVLEVYEALMKISYLSEQFGGPHHMSPEQIAFIDNWEVESYRRRIARSI